MSGNIEGGLSRQWPDRERIIATPDEAREALADIHKGSFSFDTVARKLEQHKAKYPKKYERLYGKVPPFPLERSSFDKLHYPDRQHVVDPQSESIYNLMIQKKEARTAEWEEEWRALSAAKDSIDTIQIKTKSNNKQAILTPIAQAAGITALYLPSDEEDGESYWQNKTRQEGFDFLGNDDFAGTWYLALYKARHPYYGFNAPFTTPRLGMDTTLWGLGAGIVYHKPDGFKEARAAIRRLSGGPVHVVTSTVLEMITKSGEPISYPAGYAIRIQLKDLTSEMIENYIRQNPNFTSASAGLDFAHPAAKALLDPTYPIEFLPTALPINFSLNEPISLNLNRDMQESQKFSVDTLPAFADYFKGVATDLFRSQVSNLNEVYQKL